MTKTVKMASFQRACTKRYYHSSATRSTISALFLFLSKKGIIRHVQHLLALLPVGAHGNTPSGKVKPKQAEHAMIALPDFKRMRDVYQ